MIKWFAANKLVLNIDKANIRKSVTNSSTHSALCTGYTEEMVNSKFLGLQIDKHLNWKNHTEQMNHKLSGTRYAIRFMVRICNINTLKSIYYAFFHSIINYGIIFGVTLPTVGRFSL